MNDDAPFDAPEAFSATVVPLLREYTEKLQQWEKLVAASAGKLPEQHKDSIGLYSLGVYFSDLMTRFRPGAQDLTKQVSGMIEQGRIKPLERAELRMRLAEFEAALLLFQRTLSVAARS